VVEIQLPRLYSAELAQLKNVDPSALRMGEGRKLTDAGKMTIYQDLLNIHRWLEDIESGSATTVPQTELVEACGRVLASLPDDPDSQRLLAIGGRTELV
jgi:hypothetical protein